MRALPILEITIMAFTNREEAGQQLAKRLKAYANLEDVVVLGLPRGGVPVAFEIAKALHAPLDVFLSRKLGVPGHEELAFGALAVGDGRFLDEKIIEAAGITPEQIERITRVTEKELERRALLYRGRRPPLRVQGQTVILVDDGIATGASIYAAIRALRQMKPKKLVIAVPVAPMSNCNWLRSVTDEFIALLTPNNFHAVGEFYDHFVQVSDEEVVDLLKRAEELPGLKPLNRFYPGMGAPLHSEQKRDQRELSIAVDKVMLKGTLALQKHPQGIVIFAHGSGSSRHSARNRYVAEVLQSVGLATLLFDLLTPDEESIDRQTRELRFDISLLAKRLIGVTEWVMHNPDTKNLAIGYFGASTGAAAALVAAARFPGLVDAIVSRGGRPDLAADSLRDVDAPTLLIVGGLDPLVIDLNRQALDKLKCRSKQLVIVPGATHLFEEKGTLEQVAQLAADWMVQHFADARKKKEMAVPGPAARV